MQQPNTVHPSLAELAAFDAGQLSEAEREAIEHHLADCPECGRRVDTLPEDPFVALVRISAASQDVSTSPLPHAALADLPDALMSHPRYHIVHVLGSGGMGIVYKAVHRVLDRAVALKVLHRRYTEHADFVERFRQEAKALARLSHPHIALAYDAEQAGDLHILVMEYVPGMSLDRVVAQRGPLPVAEACESVRQAALGLQHAFEHGLIHRDVKPQNLVQTPAGQIKLLDFGLAHLARVSGEQTQLASGGFAGTPDYAAPEQARNPAAADIRADVYGLGGTLYFLLTGQPPFPGSSTLQKLLAHQEQRPRPIHQFRADVPPPLQALLERMLAKDPEQRPATPAEVAGALSPFAGVRDDSAPVRSPRPRLLWLWFSAAAALAMGVVVILLWPRPSVPPTDSPRQDPDRPQVAAPVDALALATPEQIVQRRNDQCNRALTWLAENCRKGNRQPPLRETAAQFARYPGQIDSFQLVIGRQWSDAGSAFLVAGYLGSLFVYPLTMEQASALKVSEGALRIRLCRDLTDGRRVMPRVVVSDLRFDGGQRLNLFEKMSGSLAYEVRGPAIHDDFAVRLAVLLEGGRRRMVLQWFKGRALEGRGRLQFECPPLARDKVRLQGPVAVFADLCTDDDKHSLIVESDAASLLVEGLPPREPGDR